jgi:agmatine deiminase
MIPDNQTNLIYFSDLLRTESRFKSTCNEITRVIDSCGLSYKFLPNTKDIWARDYMPIQASENKFIEYRYDPDYLQSKKDRMLKTSPDLVCDALNLKTIKTDIILDGGNVIKSSDSIILTDKVLIENKDNYEEDELIGELTYLFEIDQVVLIPWDKKNDYLGHADGMVRFIDDSKVLLQGYFNFYPEKFNDKLYRALEENKIDWVKIDFNVESEDPRNWAYINFLQTKEIMIVPKFGIPEDNQALNTIKQVFPGYSDRNRIFQVDVTNLVKDGGALNCISWTILST